MIQPEINRKFAPLEIAQFVLENDKENKFLSARYNFKEFIEAIRRMNEVSQIITFDNDGEIWGVLGWLFTTEENKHQVSKQCWRLPENIVDGDILYLSFIATKGDCNILGIKKMFEDMGYRKRVNKRRGFTKNGWYEFKIFKGASNE